MRWIIFVVFIVLVEFYAFQAFKTLIKTRWVLSVYLVLSAFVIAFITYELFQYDPKVGQTHMTLFTMSLLLLVLIPKLLLFAILFIEDIFRVGEGIVRKIVTDPADSGFLPERRKFVSTIALGLAAVPFLSILYGVTKGKYNFKVIRQTIPFADLPDSFDGFTITHISDIHSGSFDNAEKINYAVDLINEQKSDMILFTGDIVNAHAKEMLPWLETFNRIHKPEFGKYSVLGNHDYGEYVEFDTAAEKDANFAAIKDLHRQIDFKLMLNEHTFINKGSDKIALVGVENWGVHFKKAGDLKKAGAGLAESDFKILMSHDPSHWEHEVKNYPQHYHLTLAGHTHGMQFGIEIPGYFRWSPAQYMYKQWAGLYENLGRYIYVNRGFGFHAYSGRVGVWPEITVIELKKVQKNA